MKAFTDNFKNTSKWIKLLVGSHHVDTRMRSNSLLNNKSAASCQQTWRKLIVLSLVDAVTVFSLFSPRGLIHFRTFWGGLIGDGGLNWEGGLFIHPKNQRWRLSLWTAINSKSLRVFESIFRGGGLIWEWGLFHFFSQKGGLLEKEAYLRGRLNREITVLYNLHQVCKYQFDDFHRTSWKEAVKICK